MFALAVYIYRRRKKYRHGLMLANFEFPRADKWEVDRFAVAFGSQIGRGAFGTVYAGEGRNMASDLPDTIKFVTTCVCVCVCVYVCVCVCARPFHNDSWT